MGYLTEKKLRSATGGLPKFFRPHRNTIRQWLVLVGLLTMRLSPPWFIAGAALVLLGSLFRLWAKGYLTQRVGLATAGPYQICRNPFYLGNLLVDLGVCAMVGRIEVAVPYILLWFIFHDRKIREEESDLSVAYGDAYDAYLHSVPRFAPRLWLLFRRSPDGGRFSWLNKNLAQRIEIPRFLSSISLPPLFYAWSALSVQGLAFFHQKHTWAFCMLCVFLWLQLLSRSLRGPLRRGERALPARAYTRVVRMTLLLSFLLLAVLVGALSPEHIADEAFRHPMALLAFIGALGLCLWRTNSALGIAIECAVCIVASLASGQLWPVFLPLCYYSMMVGGMGAARLHERYNQTALAAESANAA
ncbi:isoprenylcysteine carboxylmethyltransferase family protein [bacterium]|nr:isoprenylcysteine carboxylmethyltransferase family protein [bacterium]